MRSFIKYGLLALIVSVPLKSSAADTLKLRYITSAVMDNKGVALKLPEGVACDDSKIIVADTENDRLVSYTYQDKTLKGGDEIKVSQIAFPVRVQINSKGEIFVLDGRSHKVVHLNSDGAYVGNVDPQGVTARKICHKELQDRCE